MKSSIHFIVLLIKYVVGILLFEILHFYIQIESVYNCFSVHQCALERPTEFAISNPKLNFNGTFHNHAFSLN